MLVVAREAFCLLYILTEVSGMATRELFYRIVNVHKDILNWMHTSSQLLGPHYKYYHRPISVSV